MKKTVAFKTLGCRLNQYETDALATDFHKGGYEIVDFNKEADVYIINTCTVTNQSDHKSKNFINQSVKRKNGHSVVVVTGCMANNQKDYLENRGDLTYVVENKQKASVYSLVNAHFNGEIIPKNAFPDDSFNFTVVENGFHTRGMIKIQDGCDNFCTYCIIPKVRGRAVSRPVNDITDNIKQVISKGYKEIVLTGVNISKYHYEGTDFASLVEKILNIQGEFRLRISSIEPDGFGDKFVELFSHPKLCPHLHLCLQSGSDRILSQMRRMYNISGFLNIIEKFRKHYPLFNFTTDIITGFPGETNEDFNQTCAVVSDTGFSHVHTFPYSVRTGTRAARMPDQVPAKIKAKRSRIVRTISERNMIKYRKSLIGKQQTVLIEKILKDGRAKGYGEHYVPVWLEKGNYKTNTFRKTKLTGIEPDGTLC